MDDTIDVKLGAETREVKMSFGLLNEISRKVGDMDAIPEMALNADLRDEVLISLLSKRDSRGRITEEISFFELDATPEQISVLIEWAGAHVADFFLTSLEKTKNLIEQREGRIKALMPTSPGGAS